MKGAGRFRGGLIEQGEAEMRLLLMLALVLCALTPVVASRDWKEDPDCGMLPETVTSTLVYSGWSACDLRKADAKPIWSGLPSGTKQVSRFIFTQGHGMFYRAITITEMDDGNNLLKVSGTRNKRNHVGYEERKRTIRKKLTAEQVSLINQLAAEAGTWDHEAGTWDQAAGENGDEMEIYLHCQLLEMERANADGYRFSSVNIGCNQPKKLMPLVNEIIRIAEMKNTHKGMLFE
jgi:hypothetical protein